MKKMKYFILGLVGALSWSLYSCQNDGVEEPGINESEGLFTVTEGVITKGSTPITGGTGNYKTGENARITAAFGATIYASRKTGSGSAGQTYQDDVNKEAYLNIDDIHGDWEVSATLPDPKQYEVTVKAGDGGTAIGSGTVDEGSSCNISATANDGYTFDGWTVSSGTASIGNSSSASTTVSPSSDCTVTANFKQTVSKKYRISVSFGFLTDISYNYTSFTPQQPCINSDIFSQDYSYGSIVNLPSCPVYYRVNTNSGQSGEIYGFLVDGIWAGNTLNGTLTMNKDHNIVALYTKIE